ncbi:hypothetical protein E2C01_028517 [Portunus trituberculatus]|uniref:Uncharacterized protein n=1 Tax=Portunus trituberculatus TaxID=210409 RepID=A0A5B7EQ77_PORTR|nr:hypothetical protein [Portunus trituberculatus]
MIPFGPREDSWCLCLCRSLSRAVVQIDPRSRHSVVTIKKTPSIESSSNPSHVRWKLMKRSRYGAGVFENRVLGVRMRPSAAEGWTKLPLLLLRPPFLTTILFIHLSLGEVSPAISLNAMSIGYIPGSSRFCASFSGGR